MDATNTFAEFLATQTPHIGVAEFFANLVLAALVTAAIGMTFVRYGALSEAKQALRDIDENIQVSFLDNRIA